MTSESISGGSNILSTTSQPLSAATGWSHRSLPGATNQNQERGSPPFGRRLRRASGLAATVHRNRRVGGLWWERDTERAVDYVDRGRGRHRRLGTGCRPALLGVRMRRLPLLVLVRPSSLSSSQVFLRNCTSISRAKRSPAPEKDAGVVDPVRARSSHGWRDPHGKVSPLHVDVARRVHHGPGRRSQ